MDVDALVAKYEHVSREAEADLIAKLLQGGWEAGCWLRPDHAQLLTATQPEIEHLLELMRHRKPARRGGVDDPFELGRDCEPIDGEEPCFIVLTQRCDIVDDLRR